jgi:ketosteroid isomerase-like protein
MSEENVELIKRSADAFNRRDVDAFIEFADPEIVIKPRIAAMEGGGPYRGHVGVRRFVQHLTAAFPDWKVELGEVRSRGNLTFAEMRTRGHGAGSETPVEDTLWQVAEWRDGKCLGWQNYGQKSEALKAAGLSE